MTTEWLADLRQAAIEGDLERLATISAQVSDQSTDLSDMLAQLTADF